MLPEPTIGWYYRLLGVATLGGMLVIIGWKLYHHEAWTKEELLLVLGLFAATLALIRPSMFDDIFKAVLNFLPFVRYRHPEEPTDAPRE